MTDHEFEVYWALRLKFVDRPEARIFSERIRGYSFDPKHTLFHVVEERPFGVAHARVKLYTDFQKVGARDAERLAIKARMQMGGQGLSLATSAFAKSAQRFGLALTSSLGRATRT